MSKHLLTIISALMTILTIQTGAAYSGELQDYLDEVPGIGLIADEVNFDGITLSKLKFDTGHRHNGIYVVGEKYAIVKPGQAITVDVDYQVDACLLGNFELHHFIYGLHNDGPQACLLHHLGIQDESGHLQFQVKAPEKAGVYQLRFCHAEGFGTYERVKDEWWKCNAATSQTIMGLVIVRE